MDRLARRRWHGIAALHAVKFREAHRQEIAEGRLRGSFEDRLCAYCRFHYWDSEIDDCGYVMYRYPDCRHPLDAIRDHGPLSDDYPVEMDCWGFRPARRWDEVAAQWNVTAYEAEAAADQRDRAIKQPGNGCTCGLTNEEWMRLVEQALERNDVNRTDQTRSRRDYGAGDREG